MCFHRGCELREFMPTCLGCKHPQPDMPTAVTLIPKPRRSLGRGPRVGATIAIAIGLCWASSTVYKSVSSWSSARPVLATVEVDRGDVTQIVTEYGSIEGSDEDVIKCRVESFLGLPVAAQAGSYEARPSQARLPATKAAANSPAPQPTTG